MVRPNISAARVVVVMPNWLGDGVMATPFLRMLRELYPAAHIAAVAKPLVGPALEGLGAGFVDEICVYKKGEGGAVAKWMRGGQGFDLGISLPNSFRVAWLLWRGGAKRRLGYDRGGRRWLLTDTVAPMPRSVRQADLDRRKSDAIFNARGGNVRVGSAFEPISAVDYYLALARHLREKTEMPETQVEDVQQMEVGITQREREEGVVALAAMGIGESRFVVMVPGANFGSSKCWLPERFAEVADRLADREGGYGVKVVVASSPNEGPIVDAILAAVKRKESVHALARLNGGKGTSVGALKEIVRRAELMVCNDTGPRHFAAALGVPMVTLFGPTDPKWAQTHASEERMVRVDVACGPCQLKTCPIDHRCMTGISTEMVMAAIGDLWWKEAVTDHAGARVAGTGGGG